MIVALVQLKGGSSKTSLALALSEAGAERFGSALLVDSDAQGSASTWAELATRAGAPLRADVVSWPTGDLEQRLAGSGATATYPFIVVDSPPAIETVIRSALAAADLAVVPVRPSPDDVLRAWPTFALASQAGTPVVTVLVQTRPRTVASAAAVSALSARGYTPAMSMPLRESVSTNFGRPPGPLLGAIGNELLSIVLGEGSPHAR